MLRQSLFVALLVTKIIATAPALANDGNSCSEISFDDDPSSFSLYELKAEGRTHFIKNASSNAKECPSSSAVCRHSSFLVAGDKVVVSKVVGDFACGHFPNAKGLVTDLWLPRLALAKVAPVASWKGNWRNSWDTATIDIREANDGKLAMSGSAIYKGDSVNTGEFKATLTDPAQSTFGFAVDQFPEGDKQMRIEDAPKDGVCAMRIAQLGPYLAVVDNGGCGGLNVTFSGLYRRK